MTVSFNPPGPAARTLDSLDWAPRFSRLPEKFYTRLAPTPLPEPYLVAFNPEAAPLIGLAPGEEGRAEFAALFTGNQGFAGSTPLAAVYSGHQFGVYVPQLGDGRAISLGEAAGSEGLMEIQLKGAGRTPYSRSGDGRAVLRSSIREYLCSEAMHGLGVPTTRALAITGSDQPIIRETVETAAVVTRLAPSFVRFGSFELWYHRRDAEAVRQLADYVIREFYPEFEGAEDRYPRFLHEVVRRTARMIAQWQAVGFMHGVMNTDNMSILGLTLDYGPYGFMEAFEPGHICNHTDEGGRYAYNMQPQVGLWNLYALGQALVPLMEPEVIEAELKTYEAEFDDAMNSLLRAKLGLASARDDDHLLVNELFALMAEAHADYTLFFRTLSGLRAGDAGGDAPLRDLVINRERFDAWASQYRQRLALENSIDAERSKRMNAANPKYVLRNYLAEVAIRKARDERDYGEIENLRKLLARPYDEQPEKAHYAALPPDWASHLEVSCSS
ncbi:MAG TPA: YdiU family protein [Burkholderiales bacterium]|nr:YdiU family protein [Burkholderiales bacterium]